MLVRDAGEFRLIELLAESLAAEGVADPGGGTPDAWRLHVGIEDDAAAWDGPAGTRVLSTDALVDGVHFELGRTRWRDLGWKAMAVNLSDIAAMGCAPTCSVVTLGLRDDLPVDGLLDMYRGIAEACRIHGGRVIGGDVVRSPVFFVSVAIEGAARVHGPDGHAAVLLRGAAKTGDLIAVTGSLGDSAGGLRMVMDGERFDGSTTRLREAHFRPQPRIAAGQAVVKAGARAAMDVSDGLVGDLAKLCEASDVGAVVRGHDVPVSDALRRRFPDDWLSLALTGGEDYELLFAGREDVVTKVREAADVPVTIVGEIVESSRGVTVIDSTGEAVEVGGSGWNHFPAGRKPGPEGRGRQALAGIERVTVGIETAGGVRASEILADLRAAAETLYYPMKLVGFWDHRTDMHLCPYEERRRPCPHRLPDDALDYRVTMQRERQGSLEVFFPHAGIAVFLS